MNLGGGGYSEPRSYHCTPAWATEQNSILKKKKKKRIRGQVQWLTPMIPALWEAEVDSLSLQVQEQPGQHDKTPSLQKVQKLAVWHTPGVPAAPEAKVQESLEPRRQRPQ